MNFRIARTSRIAALVVVAALSACRSSGSGGSFLVFGGGDAPQTDLIERVRGAQGETGSAREDFAAAFRLYQRLTAPQAVELEDLSEEFVDAVETCGDSSEDLDERIQVVREESTALFEGWNAELARFSGDALRKKSEAMMLDTQARTQRVLDALERVRERTRPVLLKLQDYGLFFHHNLNARAIATLQDTYKEFDSEFKALEAELGKAEVEVASFLANFQEPRQESQGK